MLKSFLCSFLILFSSVIIETSIFSNIYFLPAVPDLVLICSLYFSLINGKLYGELTGFISGALLDFVSGAPLGFNAIFRTLIGYLSGFFNKTLNFSGIFIPALIGFSGTLAKVVLIWFVSLFFKSIKVYDIFTFSFLFELIINTILTPIMFKFLNSFFRILSIESEEI